MVLPSNYKAYIESIRSMTYSRVRKQLEDYYRQNIKYQHEGRKIGFNYHTNDDEDFDGGSGVEIFDETTTTTTTTNAFQIIHSQHYF